MKICIDIQAAIAQRAGVGRYTKSLVEHLAKETNGSDELSLFYFDFQRQGMPFPVPGAEQRACRWIPGRFVQQAWKRISFPPYPLFAGKADIYHFPNFILPPLKGAKSVVTVHDLSFLRHPETTEERNLAYLTSKIHDTVQRADAIITDSHFSAREIEELLRVPSEKIFPIHLGLNHSTRTASAEEVEKTKRELKLERPYLLTVGTLEPRKNIPFLIDVFEKMNHPDLELIIAGMPGWKYEPILERMEQSSANIRYLRYVEEEHLVPLYAAAEMFVFPSIYEGFGFPPLEAMTCGTPVFSSAAGPLPEVLGNAAAFGTAFDADAWADEITALLNDTPRREQLRQNGYEQIKKFSWQQCARETREVYRKVLS